MRIKIGKLLSWAKHFSREILIALILAVLAAVAIEGFNERTKTNIIQNAAKAVATVETYDKNGQPLSQGSGVFISSDEILVTNYHVINGSAIPLTDAKLPSGAYYKLKKFIGGDKQSDLAIVQFDGKDIPYLSPGNSDTVENGEHVYAIGSPLGLENTISDGIISNAKRLLGGKPFIQFTAAISSGNSGGGLINNGGKVVGIVTQTINIPPELQASVSAQNLNFAIPINDVEASIRGEQKLFTEDSPIYYYSIASIADNKNQYDTAITYYQKAIELDGQYADAYIGLGGDYYEKGNYELELANYLKATQLDPKNANYFYYLATAYEDNGQYGKAAQAYQQSLTLKPDDKDALHDLALLYVALGQKDKAATLVPKLTQLDPGWGKELSLILLRKVSEKS